MGLVSAAERVVALFAHILHVRLLPGFGFKTNDNGSNSGVILEFQSFKILKNNKKVFGGARPHVLHVRLLSGFGFTIMNNDSNSGHF